MFPGCCGCTSKTLGWPAEGELFASGMYPFLPGDFVKLMIAALVVGAGWAIVDHRAKKREEER